MSLSKLQETSVKGVRFLKKRYQDSYRIPSWVTWKGLQYFKTPPHSVYYITEGSGWVIEQIGRDLTPYMNEAQLPFHMSESPLFLHHSVLHFGSVHRFFSFSKLIDSSNKVITTMYHGSREMGPAMSQRIDRVLDSKDQIDQLVVSNTIMWNRFVEWGFPEEKLCLIPIAFDLKALQKTQQDSKSLRQELGIPEDVVCIGSFQKDGNGWGDGNDPKLIKGPDLFVQAVIEIAKKHPVHCLLTGPSRGYVKQKLQEANIPFTHHLLKDYSQIGDFYRCLNLYLVTSREEGGPKAVMESMGTGVPLISTRVGMAPDLIEDGKNGFLVDVGDTQAMAEKADQLLSSPDLQKSLIQHGLETAKNYDWEVISQQHAQLYQTLMQEL